MPPELNADNSLAKKAFREIFKQGIIEEYSEDKTFPVRLPDWGPNPMRKARLGQFNREADRKQADFCLLAEREKKPVICLYRRLFSYREVYYFAQAALKKWPQAWLFVLSCDRIFFDSLEETKKRQGYMRPLDKQYLPCAIKQKYFKY